MTAATAAASSVTTTTTTTVAAAGAADGNAAADTGKHKRRKSFSLQAAELLSKMEDADQLLDTVVAADTSGHVELSNSLDFSGAKHIGAKHLGAEPNLFSDSHNFTWCCQLKYGYFSLCVVLGSWWLTRIEDQNGI